MANECFFAYLFKKIENADYIMGSNTELTDYKAVLGDCQNWYKIYTRSIYNLSIPTLS